MVPMVREDLEVLDCPLHRLHQVNLLVLLDQLVLDCRLVPVDLSDLLGPVVLHYQEFRSLRLVLVHQHQRVQVGLSVQQVL